MIRACKRCHCSFLVTAAEEQHRERLSPIIQGAVFKIPAPMLCPTCRFQRRGAHRNQIYVTLRTDSLADQKLLSMYLGDTPFPVISNEEWWDEKSWCPEDYGREFDFSRPFFEQFVELRNQVPRPALNSISSTVQNSEYSNNCGGLKSCYFLFDANESEDCMYCETIMYCRDCIDCSLVLKCELCYDCAGCTNCYALQCSTNCVDCSESYFLKNCRGCTHCFGCVNLHRAKYCVFNKQLTEQEYNQYIATVSLSSWRERDALTLKVRAFHDARPHPAITGSRIESCTGNHIYDSKNVINSFFVTGVEDAAHCNIATMGGKNLYDCTIAFASPELMYETCICGLNVQRLVCCYNCWDGAFDLLCCDTSHGTKHSFGCVCLRKREYAILNKRYSKEEYYKLLPRIIKHLEETGEWGEFFPMSASPWPYNVTYSSRYFPMTEKEVADAGLRWFNKETVVNTAVEEIPDTLPRTDKAIVARCSRSGKVFKITSEEIKRLRAFNAPLPRMAYDERMNDRAHRYGGLQLFERKSNKTGETLYTAYDKIIAPVVWERDLYDREFFG